MSCPHVASVPKLPLFRARLELEPRGNPPHPRWITTAACVWWHARVLLVDLSFNTTCVIGEPPNASSSAGAGRLLHLRLAPRLPCSREASSEMPSHCRGGCNLWTGNGRKPLFHLDADQIVDVVCSIKPHMSVKSCVKQAPASKSTRPPSSETTEG